MMPCKLKNKREKLPRNRVSKFQFEKSMKRQNSLLSSSSQVEISSDNLLRRRRTKLFSCVSGLLHFLSNSRRNKSITFVHNSNNQEDAISQSPKPASAANLHISPSDSPQIAERSESGISKTTTERFRGARGPIVRLMGLDESSTAEEEGVSPAEKRRQVMEALEKCERDLKALKEFIDAFESSSAESFRSSSPANEGKRIELMIWKQPQQEEASPVSVLPRHFVNRHVCNNTMFFQRPSEYSGRTTQSHQRHEMQRNKQGEDQNLDKIKIQEIVGGHQKSTDEESVLCSSNNIKAILMRESVEEVCKDIAMRQKKEMGRIGLALQHQICCDLIEEFVRDLNFSFTICTSSSSLPFEACKRRLCF